MKKINEFFLPNARKADYTVEQWEIRKWNDDIYVYDPDLNAFDETKT